MRWPYQISRIVFDRTFSIEFIFAKTRPYCLHTERNKKTTKIYDSWFDQESSLCDDSCYLWICPRHTRQARNWQDLTCAQQPPSARESNEKEKKVLKRLVWGHVTPQSVVWRWRWALAIPTDERHGRPRKPADVLSLKLSWNKTNHLGRLAYMGTTNRRKTNVEEDWRVYPLATGFRESKTLRPSESGFTGYLKVRIASRPRPEMVERMFVQRLDALLENLVPNSSMQAWAH